MADAATDPLGMWRDWLTQSERQWNGFMNEMMATDQFSQGMGKMMDVYLTMQKSMNDAMGRYFSAINVPTRTDVLSIGNRLSEIEERLGGIETAIRAMAAANGHTGQAAPEAAAAVRPPRTKRPPSEASTH
ncbi:MAG: hypothetical protein ACKVVT_18350 [Dehalococcoidia bacterium]